MKKFKPLVLASVLPLLLSSCGVDKGIVFWHPFGASYTTALNTLVNKVASELNYTVTPETQGSYDKLQTNIMNSIANASFPYMALGYPDHFAGYILNNVMLDLTPFIQKYNEKHNVNLEEDYYEQYMAENKDLKEGKIFGLPFNKSTEVMVYNADLFEYVKSLDSSITKLPETWDDFMTEGPKYLTALKGQNLFKVVEGKQEYPGKGVAAKYNANGVASEFKLVEKANNRFDVGADYTLIADFSNVQESDFNVIMSDSTDNLFITVIRQWGSSYTGFTAQEQASRAQKGHIEFWNDKYPEYKAKTIDALTYLYDLHTASKDTKGHVFNLGGELYNSDDFKVGSVFFNICSSGGLSNNVPTGAKAAGQMTSPNFNVGILPIPYKDAAHKFVISQGTNLGMFDKGLEEEKAMEVFDVMVGLSTGEHQGEWAATTGYYPASKSATASTAYQEFINNTNPTAEKVLYQISSQVNEREYMDDAKGWVKFVDKAFIGSSSIRGAVKPIIRTLLSLRTDIEAGELSIDEAISSTINEALKNYKEYIK